LLLKRYWLPLSFFIYDGISAVVLPFAALFLRFEGEVDSRYFLLLIPYLPFIVVVRLGTFYLFRLYHRIWRYAGIDELLAILVSTTASSIVIATVMILMKSGIPRSVYLLTWGMTIALVGFSRALMRIYYHYRLRSTSPQKNVLIVGAGDAGAMMAKEVANHWSVERKVVGFIDDDPRKQGQQLMGIPILGTRDMLPYFAAKLNVADILIAMPSVSGKIIREIVGHCKQTNCSIKILPGLFDLIEGKVQLQNLRNVDLEDLLRREPICLDVECIRSYLRNKRVLITGAGGSIGSEICRQVSRLEPAQLMILGKGENSIYEIQQELSTDDSTATRLVPLIADIRDRERIEEIFARFSPQVVFHAAAHKHVPLMELQPVEAIRNNIEGTQVLVEAADRTGVETFIMISTDKAVNPTSVMGVTKRIAEMVVQQKSQSSKTRFAAVRFGNVLGSRGSVIPLFRKQIAAGGPITVTDPNMKRYFMTIPEATQLVLQAGAMSKGGEVFVLDMGEPVRIVDMAEDLIRLSGFEPYKDIEIVFTQSRPGEKLFEELLTAEEGTSATHHDKIFVANLRSVDEKVFWEQLETLRQAVATASIKQALQAVVPSYKPYKEGISTGTKEMPSRNNSSIAGESLTIPN